MSAQPCSRNQGSNEVVCGIHQADNRCLTTSGRRRCSYTFSVMMCCLMGPPERSSMCRPYQIAPSLSCSPCFSAADQHRSAAQQIDVVVGKRWLNSGFKTVCRQSACHAGSLDAMQAIWTSAAERSMLSLLKLRMMSSTDVVQVCTLQFHDMVAQARSKPCIMHCRGAGGVNNLCNRDTDIVDLTQKLLKYPDTEVVKVPAEKDMPAASSAWATRFSAGLAPSLAPSFLPLLCCLL